jgi:hypothetical protein
MESSSFRTPFYDSTGDEVQYCEISKEMSTLYFGLDVQYSTKLKLESQNSTQCAEYTVRGVVEELRDQFWDSSLK